MPSIKESPSVEPYPHIQDDLKTVPQGLFEWGKWDVSSRERKTPPADWKLKLSIAGRRELEKLPKHRPYVFAANRSKNNAERARRDMDAEVDPLSNTDLRWRYVTYYAQFGIIVGK